MVQNKNNNKGDKELIHGFTFPTVTWVEKEEWDITGQDFDESSAMAAVHEWNKYRR